MRIDGNAYPGGGIGGRALPIPTEPVKHRPPDRVHRTGYTWGTATPDADAVARIAAAEAAKAAKAAQPRADKGTPRIDVPVAEIVAAYEAGDTAPQLAERYGVHRNTILRRLADAGVTIRDGRYRNGGAHPRKDTTAP